MRLGEILLAEKWIDQEKLDAALAKQRTSRLGTDGELAAPSSAGNGLEAILASLNGDSTTLRRLSIDPRATAALLFACDKAQHTALLLAVREAMADGSVSSRVAYYNDPFVDLWGLRGKVGPEFDEQELIEYVKDKLDDDSRKFLVKAEEIYQRSYIGKPAIHDTGENDLLYLKQSPSSRRRTVIARSCVRITFPNDRRVWWAWSFRDVTEASTVGGTHYSVQELQTYYDVLRRETRANVLLAENSAVVSINPAFMGLFRVNDSDLATGSTLLDCIERRLSALDFRAVRAWLASSRNGRATAERRMSIDDRSYLARIEPVPGFSTRAFSFFKKDRVHAFRVLSFAEIGT